MAKLTPAQKKALEMQNPNDQLNKVKAQLTADNHSLDKALKESQSKELRGIVQDAIAKEEPKLTLFQEIAQDWSNKNGALSNLTERLEAFTDRTVGESSAHKPAKLKNARTFSEAAEQNLDAMHTSLLRFHELLDMLDNIG